MSFRRTLKAFQILALLPVLIFLSAGAVGAKNLYPTVGEFVDVLSKELAWPAGSTTEEKVFALRAEKVIPSYLTPSHAATPTVVMAIMGGLLQHSRAKGDDPNLVLGALIHAAVASGAPMPTFPPDEKFHLDNVDTAPAVQPKMDSPPFYPPSIYYPFSAVSAVIVHKGFSGHQLHRKEMLNHIREFPHTIFRIGESPAEKGPGVFPRR